MRLVLLVAFLLLGAGVSTGAALGQSRQTICLHDAESGVCKELLGRLDEQKKRIGQMENERQRSVCYAIAERRFFRECANQFVARPRNNLACYRVFKAQERNMRASLAKLRAQTRVDVRRCE